MRHSNDFLCFVHSSRRLPLIMIKAVSVADGAIRQIYSPIQHIIITSLSISLSFMCSLSSISPRSSPLTVV